MLAPEEMPPNGKIIDITVPISPSTPIFPGDPEPSIESTCTLEKDGCAVSRLTFGSHTGTHVDAPSHILKGGLTADNLSLKSLMGKAIVLDFSGKNGALTESILDKTCHDLKIPEDVSIILLKTSSSFPKEKNPGIPDPQLERIDARNGSQEFSENSVYLDTGAASWIVRNGFKTAGIDSFSVDNFSSESLPAHHILLSNGINIVECLDLNSVKTGIYFFLCLPLKIEGCDGAPARALLISYP